MKYFLVLLVSTVIEANVHLDRLEMCDKKSYPFKYTVKLKESDGKQILEYGSFEANRDLNNDILNTVSVYQLDDKEWNLLITKTDPACVMVENFIGEFMKGLEKASGLKGTCPYPKGKYEIKDYPLDFSTFKHQEFPPGTVKIRSEYFGKEDETKSLGCYEIQFTLK